MNAKVMNEEDAISLETSSASGTSNTAEQKQSCANTVRGWMNNTHSETAMQSAQCWCNSSRSRLLDAPTNTGKER